MKKLIFIILVALFPTLVNAYALQGRIIKVMDGDTVEMIDSSGKTYRARLANIDAPEKSQAFGNVSRNFLASLIAGKQVTMKIQEKDKYGRYIADIYVNNDYVNAIMVDNGLAWVYSHFNKNPALVNLQSKAKQQKIGLWADPYAVAPWEYRKTR